MRYVLIFAVLLLLSCGGSVGNSYDSRSVQEAPVQEAPVQEAKDAARIAEEAEQRAFAENPDYPGTELGEVEAEKELPFGDVINWRGVGGLLGGNGLFVVDVRVYNPYDNLMNGFSIQVKAYNNRGGLMGVADYHFKEKIQGYEYKVVNCRFPLTGRKKDVYAMDVIVTNWH